MKSKCPTIPDALCDTDPRYLHLNYYCIFSVFKSKGDGNLDAHESVRRYRLTFP